MAYGSRRHEEESVGMRALELVDNLWSEFVADFARRINSTHEAERRIDELADDTVGFELAHPCEREYAVGVALGVARRIAEVPHAQFVGACVDGNAAIRRVFAMEAGLIAIHYSARADQRDSALCDGFGEWSERRRFVVDPSIRREPVVEIARAGNVCDWHGGFRLHSTMELKVRQTARMPAANESSRPIPGETF